MSRQECVSSEMPIKEQILHRLGNPLEWSSARKASVLLWSYFIDQLLYQLFLWMSKTWEYLIPWANQAQAAYHQPYFNSLIVTSICLIGFSHVGQRRGHTSVVYEYVACLYFGLTHVYYGYCIGLMSFPVGVVLVGAPVVGFILSDRGAVAAAFVASVLLVAVLTVVTMHDVIPYAPLAVGLHDDAGQMAPIWVVAYVIFALPHLGFIFGLSYFVLERWKLREQEATHLSRTDSLTGLLNRRHIMSLLGKEKLQCETRKSDLAVVMIDLDHFKSINDKWGHDVGDSVLSKVAHTLRNSLRELDHVGRYGGEEFLVVLPGLDAGQAERLAQRVRSNIAAIEVVLPSGERLPISASLGMCCYCGDAGTSIEDLVKRADVALYMAKDGGRDQLVVALP